MMRGVNTDEEFLWGDGMRTQKGCDCILLTLGIGQDWCQICSLDA